MFRVGDNELIDGELMAIMETTEVDDGELLRVEDQFGNEKFYKYSDEDDEFIEIEEEDFYQIEFFEEDPEENLTEEERMQYEEAARKYFEETEEVKKKFKKIIALKMPLRITGHNITIKDVNGEWIGFIENNKPNLKYAIRKGTVKKNFV